MSSPPSPRKVIVDDNDPSVHYYGPWYLVDGQDYHANGGIGEPYYDTMHGTTGKASFSYSFIGSTGQIMGFADISNSSSVKNPSWECILDGVSIPVNNPPKSPTSDWSFCQWNSTIGSHTITVNVNGHGKDFWFDQLIYVPDPEIVVKNATVLVTHTDAALMYHSGWMPAESDSRMATGGGSVLTFPFFGSGLSWFGNIPGGKSQSPMTGFFSVDGQPPINFTAVAPPGYWNTKSPQLFFKTPPLPQSTHTLTVTSLGAGQSGPIPLSLSHLVLNNAELPVLDFAAPQTATISTASSVPTSISTTSTSIQPSHTEVGGQHMIQSGSQSSQKGPPSKVIIGGVIGGVVFCFLVLFTLLFIRRRRRTKLGSAESAFTPPPPYTPQNMSQVSGRPSTAGSQEYPFALPGGSSRNHFSNFTKRFTSISTRPNSLFQTARLSVLPVKRPPSLASSASSRTYRPYVSRPRSNTRSSTGSTATLLPSAPPSRKTSMISFRDDETVVVEHKDGEVRIPPRPPEGTEYLPTYSPG